MSLLCHSLAIRLIVSSPLLPGEVRCLLLNFAPYGGTDPLGMFSLYLKITDVVLSPRFSVVFRRLGRLGRFPACWRKANVTQILKGPPSNSVSNSRQRSTTSVLFGVFQRLESVHIRRFMESRVVRFADHKGIGTSDALLCMSHTLQSALECGLEARIVQIDFSPTFGRVNHHEILHKLCSLGIVCAVLTILT